MFSNVTVALIFGLGFGAWVYGKTQRRTGNNTQSSLLVAGLCALAGFVVVVTILSVLF
jgi:hypothetical protein